MTNKIGLGGSCHWCTEAIFQSLKGVSKVEQGWITPADDLTDFSEAVIVTFDPFIISEEVLIAIHLATHSSTADHAMRAKYRSAVYVFSEEQAISARSVIAALQQKQDAPIITQVLPFGAFKLNTPAYLNYYYDNPEKPFCQTFIQPKLRMLQEQFTEFADINKHSY